MDKEKDLELPKNFVMDLEISDDILNLIINQYKEIQEHNKGAYLSYPSITLTDDNKLFLKEGTLIHGVRKNITKEYLESVKEKGLLASEFLGLLEDGETFYSLDFYRVEKDYTMEEYYNWYTTPYLSGVLKKKKPEFNFLPRYDDIYDTETIAFVVNNTADLYKFLQYDFYRENENYELLKQIVNLGIVDDYKNNMQDRLATVLVGVPFTSISGILITNKLAHNTIFMNTLKSIFPNSYIALAKDGTIVYMPPYISIKEQNKLAL